MPRASSVLDGGGSRVETFGFPTLLQYGSRSRVAGESDSDSDCGIQTRRSQMLCVAETLSRFISNAKSRMKTNSPRTRDLGYFDFTFTKPKETSAANLPT